MSQEAPHPKSYQPFLAGALLSFGMLLLGTEALLRATVPTGFWYRHFDLSGDLTSLAELQDRLHYAVPPQGRLLLLGDSVLGASSLMEHRLPQARQKTLSRALARLGPGLGWNPLSLGSDGLLLPDIEGLSAEFLKDPPRRVLLLLNFRMFAKDFASGPKALSRAFLGQELPGDLSSQFAPDPPPTQEAVLSDRLYAALSEGSFLFRETQAAKVLWYYPSQKDFFQRILERVVGRNEEDSDLAEEALLLKVGPYYQAYDWDVRQAPFQSLGRILDEWAKKGVPATVVLTPQNAPFLGGALDRPSYERNRRMLSSFMKAHAFPGLTFRDWADRYPSSLFLDHCHLTPEGNERYAADLLALVGGTPP